MVILQKILCALCVFAVNTNCRADQASAVIRRMVIRAA